MIGKVMLLKKVAGRNAITHRFVCVKAILLVLGFWAVGCLVTVLVV